MGILQSLEKNADEIRQVQQQINQTESIYRKRDLNKRLRKLKKERAEALRWLRSTEGQQK